ncbi:MAG: hypothetical protein WD271_15780 [Acidimicrobiia bacterium]
MVDDAANEDTETVNCTILEGPDGSLYVLSDENLAAHRLRDDVAEALRSAYEEKPEVSGFKFLAQAPPPAFQILAQGPVVRRTGLTAPTQDGWFDIYA